MQHIPQGLCQAWIELGRDLDPKRLIPALVQLDHSPEKNQVRIEYTSGVMSGMDRIGSRS